MDRAKCIMSFNDGGGIGLKADNEVSNLIIKANPSKRAIDIESSRRPGNAQIEESDGHGSGADSDEDRSKARKTRCRRD